ncbi:MAG: hypothetical protein ACREVC_11585, partial [Burkholderiales bacterium]
MPVVQRASVSGDSCNRPSICNRLFLLELAIGTQCAWLERRSTTHRGIHMLQKEGLFRRREESFPARTPAA